MLDTPCPKHMQFTGPMCSSRRFSPVLEALLDASCVDLFCFLPQEFGSYNSLGQSQFSQYYTLPPSYVPAGLPSSDEHSAGVGVAGYSAVKSEEAASAGLPPRGVSLTLNSLSSASW